MSVYFDLMLSDDQKRRACELAAEGLSIQRIRETLGFKSATPFRTARNKDPEFQKAFDRARREGLEELADKLIDVAETTPDIYKARLQSENLRWLLSKRKPETYGDRVDVNLNQTVELGSALRDARARALPVCDQQPVVETQGVNLIGILPRLATGGKSVAVPSDDAEENTSLDIFS